ncbi:hypothetical protein PVAG01_01660 [Phlyctema vagabunda]|uniref:Uncharacterized protein n=1 Tax=Phlyctema vagabunda TaxID=108571 RepID=A0ABR4PZ26_9HELO
MISLAEEMKFTQHVAEILVDDIRALLHQNCPPFVTSHGGIQIEINESSAELVTVNSGTAEHSLLPTLIILTSRLPSHPLSFFLR